MAVDMNSTLSSMIMPIASSVEYLLGYVKILAGGMAGLYIFYAIFKVREAIILKRLVKEIQKDMEQLKDDFFIIKEELGDLKKFHGIRSAKERKADRAIKRKRRQDRRKTE